ncbi:hypothetical protein L1887_13837 [Cichorium endivia]|nr:hypothetical protein L1887_13837 [Cichorium endivia]
MANRSNLVNFTFGKGKARFSRLGIYEGDGEGKQIITVQRTYQTTIPLEETNSIYTRGHRNGLWQKVENVGGKEGGDMGRSCHQNRKRFGDFTQYSRYNCILSCPTLSLRIKRHRLRVRLLRLPLTTGDYGLQNEPAERAREETKRNCRCGEGLKCHVSVSCLYSRFRNHMSSYVSLEEQKSGCPRHIGTSVTQRT